MHHIHCNFIEDNIILQKYIFELISPCYFLIRILYINQLLNYDDGAAYILSQ